jgi:charged multivesicular body protein 1
MQRSSKKCEKNEAAAKLKVKADIKKGNLEGARIQAQNAIREKNQALNCLRLSSRIDAVASRLETAVRMQQVNKSMEGVVRGMKSALASMDVERISTTMDQFEKQFEDMDVVSGYMENAMNTTTAMGTPQEQVSFIQARFCCLVCCVCRLTYCSCVGVAISSVVTICAYCSANDHRSYGAHVAHAYYIR